MTEVAAVDGLVEDFQTDASGNIASVYRAVNISPAKGDLCQYAAKEFDSALRRWNSTYSLIPTMTVDL